MRRWVLLLLLLFPLLLSGCLGRQTPSARELFDRLASAYPLPPGTVYDSRAGRSEAEYLDPLLFSALYCRADGSSDAEDIAETVLFLGRSGRECTELAILRCRGIDAAREVAGLCTVRAELLHKTLGCEVRVLRYGETVLLLALPDNDAAERILRRMLA